MLRVLIVDDNEENLYYLQSLLTASNYEVIKARNGKEALDSALREPPNLIVSDILMPVMDGFTLCRRWHEEPLLLTIPFLFYTATYTDPKDKELGLDIGADDFLVKPLEPEVLLRIIQELLKRGEEGKLPRHSSTETPPVNFLREYNAALIRKLEDKLVQLEASNQKLADTEVFVRAILNSSPLPILAVDLEERIKLANPAFYKVFGYSPFETEGRRCSDLIDLPEGNSEKEVFSRLALGEEVPPHYSRRRCKDGEVIEVEAFFSPMKVHDNITGFIVIFQDITEQRKIEEQLQQAQKLEAIGQFAAGMAHDFNNLLGVMVGYSEMVRGEADPQSQLFHHADQIQQACMRAAALTRQLLVFSRRQGMNPEIIDLGSYLQEMTQMLRRLVREDIELQCNTHQAGCTRIDPVQFEQVVLNLVSNASDAMPKGGQLNLDLCDVDLRAEATDGNKNIPPGEYVRFTITDSGTGMSQDTMARIFDAFYTTKPKGSGTGLGLASVRSIIDQTGGKILVSSQLGKGTTFEVYFPKVQGSAPRTSQPSKPSLYCGSEKIMLVEDEDALRTLFNEMLTRLGYRVLCVSSAKDAARIVQETNESIDLLITDVVMPGMSGLELSEVVRASRPDINILYVSGYEEELPPLHEEATEHVNFLAKPFTHVQLAGVIRRILDKRAKSFLPDKSA